MDVKKHIIFWIGKSKELHRNLWKVLESGMNSKLKLAVRLRDYRRDVKISKCHEMSRSLSMHSLGKLV